MGDHPQRRNWDQEAPDYGTVFIVFVFAQQEEVGFSSRGEERIRRSMSIG
jgi:hypothetical protein